MIPTAEELLIKYRRGDDAIISKDVNTLMIEFAKLHVQEALKQATIDAEAYVIGGLTAKVDKSTILNAYPLEKIK